MIITGGCPSFSEYASVVHRNMKEYMLYCTGTFIYRNAPVQYTFYIYFHSAVNSLIARRTVFRLKIPKRHVSKRPWRGAFFSPADCQVLTLLCKHSISPSYSSPEIHNISTKQTHNKQSRTTSDKQTKQQTNKQQKKRAENE